MSFNVGDRVKIVGANWTGRELLIGQTGGILVGPDKDGDLRVLMATNRHWVGPASSLEALPDLPDVLTEYKSKVIVELRKLLPRYTLNQVAEKLDLDVSPPRRRVTVEFDDDFRGQSSPALVLEGLMMAYRQDTLNIHFTNEPIRPNSAPEVP